VVKIRVDPNSRTPVSEQLRARIAARIASRRLAPGERLPPIRTLAAELGLATNTVAKAYRELESAGLLVGRGRLGTFVAEALPPLPGDAEVMLDEAARAFARRAGQLGVPPDRALALAERALRPPSP
jgi:DNA-binding transcriptional regulator YhcF (GntR family)